jgi:hypothetical protein
MTGRVINLMLRVITGVLTGCSGKMCSKNPLAGGLLDKFNEIYATIAVDRQFGYQKMKLSGVKLPEGAPHNHFVTAVTKVAG